jgi:hypothetical protein
VFGLFKPLLVFFGIEIFIFSTVPGGKTRVKKLEEIARWTLERIPATAPNTRLDMRLPELQNAAESRRYVKNTIPWQILIIKAIFLRHSGKHASRGGGGEFGPFFVLAKIPFHLVPQIYSHFITLIKYFLEYT